MSALLGVGGGAGVVLAGPIVDHLSFHYLFWLPLVPIVVATVAVHLFVPESPVRSPGRVNWTGARVDVARARRAADRGQRDGDLALALGPHDRLPRCSAWCCSLSGCAASRGPIIRSSTCT